MISLIKMALIDFLGAHFPTQTTSLLSQTAKSADVPVAEIYFTAYISVHIHRLLRLRARLLSVVHEIPLLFWALIYVVFEARYPFACNLCSATVFVSTLVCNIDIFNHTELRQSSSKRERHVTLGGL